ncbi:MAG: dprA [Paenibacillaceae bacterium]|jgi:DNA processing protein|nr:dprA [Paenibacillaceae bacterium]
MNNSTIILALHEIEGVGGKTIRQLLRYFPELEEVLDTSLAAVRALDLPPGKAELLKSRLTRSYVAATEEKYARSMIYPITRLDPEYPPLLNQTGEPPWVLYAIGRTELLHKPAIAVVGTRLPTVYGKRMAELISRGLSQAGVAVVSGLARGIDGAAHQGAVAGAGGTIAVLGSGIDVIYPREHAHLYRELAEKGLILSEYPPGTRSVPGLFPKRNRIIAGLALGTLVIEAALKSGSLITSDIALEESRDVFALPGPVTSPKSAGTNNLIQSGAKLVACAEDILCEYVHIIGASRNICHDTVNNNPEHKELTPEEAGILEFLAQGPATIDELIERFQTNFGHLHAILLSLLLTKRIEQLPGSVYVLI